MNARRISIYGVTGSGKTTFARRLSERTGICWHSVDDLTFEENWRPVAPEEQRRRIGAICAGDEWIIDTMYGQWLDIPLARVELIVALDYPRWLSLIRLLRRTTSRMISGEPVCNGNREGLRQVLSRESIVLWHFRSFARKRARIAAFAADPEGPSVVRLRHPREAEAWLSENSPIH